MSAYYNEFDPYAAQWIRNLITAGHIADGIVDERSIADVTPDDLKGFVQCHFFAGIGVWSHALRAAGWDDNRPVWTGSCPCQPFSVAGTGGGTSDERHLWPVWFKLIEKCQPPVVFGEQVEAAIRHGWLDLVQTDMERIDYAFAAAGIPAAGVGAPHIRQRLWFVAESSWRGVVGGRSDGGLCNAEYEGLEGHTGAEGALNKPGRDEKDEVGSSIEASTTLFVADTNKQQLNRKRNGRPTGGREFANSGTASQSNGQSELAQRQPASGPTNGHWRNADWLACQDGKWRPVEPGTFPLANGATARVGRLRAYGNAIVSQVAQELITAYMSVRP